MVRCFEPTWTDYFANMTYSSMGGGHSFTKWLINQKLPRWLDYMLWMIIIGY